MDLLSEKAHYDIVSGAFESAAEADAAGWQQLYENLSHLISAGPGTIHFRRKAADRFEPVADTNEPGFIDQFNSVYWDLVPYKQAFVNLRTGQDFLRTRDVSESDFVPSELYQDHFEKLGIYEILHHCLFDDDRFAAGITFTRSKSEGPFSSQEQKFISDLAPHLSRAARLHMRVSDSRISDRIMIEGWHLLKDGIFLIAENGGVVFANAAAEEHLKNSSALKIDRKGRLSAHSPAQNRRLIALIDSVFTNAADNSLLHGGELRLRGTNDRDLLCLSVTPFRESGKYAVGSPKYALVHLDLTSQPASLKESDLLDTYGLTRAEARLATLLADGRDLNEIGDVLQVTQNTVRTHLKRIFSKTGTNRQSSLVRLILSGSSAALANRIGSIISSLSLIWVTT